MALEGRGAGPDQACKPGRQVAAAAAARARKARSMKVATTAPTPYRMV